MSAEKIVSVAVILAAMALMALNQSWASVTAFASSCAVYGLCVWLERKQRFAVDALQAELDALKKKQAEEVAQLKSEIQGALLPRGFGMGAL